MTPEMGNKQIMTIKIITFDPPIETDHPTLNWWKMTTDADAEIGNAPVTIGAEMHATADAIAAEIAAKYLRSEIYATNFDNSLQGKPVTIHLTAPDGTKTQHPTVYT